VHLGGIKTALAVVWQAVAQIMAAIRTLAVVKWVKPTPKS